MPKIKLDRQVVNTVNAHLINNKSISEVAEKTNLDYHTVQRMRYKLVHAGVLKPLYKTTKKRRNSRTASTLKSAISRKTRVSTLDNNNQSIAQQSNVLRMVINGTELNIQNVKCVNVLDNGAIDIKY